MKPLGYPKMVLFDHDGTHGGHQYSQHDRNNQIKTTSASIQKQK